MEHRSERLWQQLQIAVVFIFVVIQTSQAVDDIYSPGRYDVVVQDVSGSGNWFPNFKCRDSPGSPKPAGTSPANRLLISAPNASGTYPVIQLHHGFTLRIDFYSQLLEHLATYGYIVVAPQAMDLVNINPNAKDEIAQAADTLDWYPNNLEAKLAEIFPNLDVKPDLEKVILAGHSRGGKVAFGLATGVCKSVLSFAGIVGLDPVDGGQPYQQTQPPILPNKPFGLDLPFPTLIVGSGLGKWCAPAGVNHDAFFNNSAPLAYHFVAPEYGHMDFLDDKLNGPFQYVLIADHTCWNGPSRGPFRTFTGGIMVAFLDSILFNNGEFLDRALMNIPDAAPVKLDTPQVTKFISEYAVA
ncbi:hypothetical protein R1sor_026186 [Riccia sorocarpa]|uniref:Chlorophyllase n=1 Tax=Riccia sorocarpa TaxID=122646 RepID=A0ABD3GBB0_9MARC